jgi:dipeptidyl aminopeptidase/acylaminoacyl peptidase
VPVEAVRGRERVHILAGLAASRVDARVKGKSEPWSTNFDLYEVSVEGGEPRNLTADNPAWDAQPVFSPDGSMMAWRAMRRPGFEADRFHVMVMDLKSGERRELAQDWDRSADQIGFSADNARCTRSRITSASAPCGRSM